MMNAATSNSSTTDMKELVRLIVDHLERIAGLEPLWKKGIVHRGGPHYRLKGTLGPVSLGEDECLIFGKLIEAFRPRNCFIIGNAFGMSSVFIAKAMEAHGGESVITLDSKGEGDGQRCYDTAGALKSALQCTILKNKWGWSPQDVPNAVEAEQYDLIFIDGDHSHPQVTKDFYAIQPYAGEFTLVCWHDYWMEGIPESVAAAEQAGFRCLKVNSSCEMVFGARNGAVFDRLRALFPNSEQPEKRLRPIAYARLYRGLATGAVKRRLMR